MRCARWTTRRRALRKVRRGAWATDEHHGWNFHQWQGSFPQRDAMARVHDVSRDFHAALEHAGAAGIDKPEARNQPDQAHWRLLRAETSCHFYWGEAWVYKVHHDLDAALRHLDEARACLG